MSNFFHARTDNMPRPSLRVSIAEQILNAMSVSHHKGEKYTTISGQLRGRQVPAPVVASILRVGGAGEAKVDRKTGNVKLIESSPKAAKPAREIEAPCGAESEKRLMDAINAIGE